MRIWVSLAVTLLFIGPVRADPADDYADAATQIEEERRAAYIAAVDQCSPEAAERVSFVALAINSVAFTNRCVRLSGVAYGREVYLFPEQAYLSERFRGSAFDFKDPNPFRVGLDVRRVDARLDDRLYEIEIVGVARDCAASDSVGGRAAWASATLGGGIIVSTDHSFCGWFGYGAAIDAVAVEYGRTLNVPRLVGEAARERFGSIWQIPSENPAYEPIDEFGDFFLAALQAGDVAALADYPDNLQAHFFTDRPESVFNRLRDRTGMVERALFWANDLRRNPSALPTALYAGDENSELFSVCYCLDDDCSGRWPISWFDTWPRDDRPFACVSGDAIWDDAGHFVIDMQSAWHPLFRGGSPFFEPERQAQ